MPAKISVGVSLTMRESPVHLHLGQFWALSFVTLLGSLEQHQRLKLDVVACACNPSTWEAEWLRVQGTPRLHGMLKASLSFMGTCVKNKTKGKSKIASSCTPMLTLSTLHVIMDHSFSHSSPVFIFFFDFCKQFYYLCAHVWKSEEISEEQFSVSPCGIQGLNLGIRLAILPAETSQRPHFFTFPTLHAWLQ